MAILVVLVIIALELFLIPIMFLYNKITESKYDASAKQYVTGELSVGIKDKKAVGQVVISGAGFGKVVLPAMLFDDETPSLNKHDKVLIVETKEGIAYVVPRGVDVFENL
jgi:hypothetical protein